MSKTKLYGGGNVLLSLPSTKQHNTDYGSVSKPKVKSSTGNTNIFKLVKSGIVYASLSLSKTTYGFMFHQLMGLGNIRTINIGKIAETYPFQQDPILTATLCLF